MIRFLFFFFETMIAIVLVWALLAGIYINVKKATWEHENPHVRVFWNIVILILIIWFLIWL